jgi:cytochrome P450
MPLVRPPGPPPVTRHPLSLLRHARAMGADPTDVVQSRFDRYGDLYHLRFLGRDVYVTRHPEHIQQVLIGQAEHFSKPRDGLVARQLGRLLGQGLLNSDGALWRAQRRMIQPAFRRERLDAYALFMAHFAQAFAASLRDGEEIDVSRSMIELTLRIVTKALFDREDAADNDRVRRATEAFRRAFGIAALLPSFVPTKTNRGLKRALADLDALIYGLIEQRRSQPDSARSDLLSALSEAVDTQGDGRAMTKQQVRDELLTLLLTGHETTSHALSWTFHLLARHPEVEARLREEAEAVLSEGPISARTADKLLYTEQVLSETMRLFPPAYALARQACSKTEVGGYVVPENTDVVLWLYHVQRDARWFPDPTRFDPERFSAARRAAITPFSYLPFGAGSRACIGKHFALIEAKLVLACTLRRVSFSPRAAGEVARDMAVTLAPKGGLPMRVRAVSDWAAGL